MLNENITHKLMVFLSLINRLSMLLFLFFGFFLVYLAFRVVFLVNLDLYDKKIIKELSLDGRMSVSELANRIGLSKTPCQNRLKRLIENDYITGFRAVVNHAKLDQEMVAFTEVTMSDTKESALAAFNAAVKKIPEIEQCHLIAGTFDYLLKIRTSNMNQYRKVLAEIVSVLPYLASTSTYVSMQSIKDRD